MDFPLPVRGAAGGVYKQYPEDFEVEETSLFDPDGRPGHLFLWVEKRELSTPALVQHLAEVLAVSADAIGYAGMKDSFALSRQWMSVPMVAKDRLDRVERARILRVESNSGRLRTGELAGNRFRLVLRGSDRSAVERWLEESDARLPNYFGRQRFGDSVDTHRAGFSFLRGETRPRRGRMMRLALSAAQSALFNAYLAARVDRGAWDQWIDGDVVLRPDGRDFHGTADAARDAVRKRAAVVAGPIFGPHMKPATGEAARLEAAVLEAACLDDTHFDRFRKLTAGSRRSTVLSLGEIELDEHDGAPRLCFSLPPGAYATVVLEALGVLAAA